MLAPSLQEGVYIGNATPADLRVYVAGSVAAGQTGYFVVAAGYDKKIETIMSLICKAIIRTMVFSYFFPRRNDHSRWVDLDSYLGEIVSVIRLN